MKEYLPDVMTIERELAGELADLLHELYTLKAVHFAENPEAKRIWEDQWSELIFDFREFGAGLTPTYTRDHEKPLLDRFRTELDAFGTE